MIRSRKLEGLFSDIRNDLSGDLAGAKADPRSMDAWILEDEQRAIGEKMLVRAT